MFSFYSGLYSFCVSTDKMHCKHSSEVDSWGTQTINRGKLRACYNELLGGSLWFVCDLTVKTKRWNLGIKTNPSLAFGISPSSYFTDGKDNAEENDMWKQEHKHCFVWQRKPGPFMVNVYLVIIIDNTFIFQPVYSMLLFFLQFIFDLQIYV